MSWFGNTGKSATETAAKYLDFLNEIKKGNGTISTAGIKALAEKWYGGSGESATSAARKYEQAVVVLKDQNLGKAEVELLMKAWNASAEEVGQYLLATRIPFQVEEDAKVMFSPSLIAAIAAGWNAATTALEKYLNAAKAASGIVIPTAPVIPGAPVVIPKAGDPALGGSKTDSAAAAAAAADAAARAAASAAAAAAYAAAKAAGDSDAAAIAAAGVNPSALASGESGAIGAASIAAQLRAAEEAQRAAADAARQAATLEAFKAKEAADAATAQAVANAADYDERFRFQSNAGASGSSFDVGSFRKADNAGMTINLNVEGNVSTEQDIVQAIRQGLLAGQTNGNTLTLQAI